MSTPTYNFGEIKDPYMHRFSEEHLRLDRLAKANPDLLEYKGVEFSREFPHPPSEYHIVYKVNGIVRINEDESPVFGDRFEMSLSLPVNFPEQPAVCKMISDTWHPNIKSDGPFKGSICTNHEGFGSLFFIDELVVRIGEFLQYKRYLAEDVEPWPENQKVARWVRNYAQPKGLVNRREALAIDERPWNRAYALGEEEEFTIDIIEKGTETPEITSNGNDSTDDSDISFFER